MPSLILTKLTQRVWLCQFSAPVPLRIHPLKLQKMLDHHSQVSHITGPSLFIYVWKLSEVSGLCRQADPKREGDRRASATRGQFLLKLTPQITHFSLVGRTKGGSKRPAGLRKVPSSPLMGIKGVGKKCSHLTMSQIFSGTSKGYREHKKWWERKNTLYLRCSGKAFLRNGMWVGFSQVGRTPKQKEQQGESSEMGINWVRLRTERPVGLEWCNRLNNELCPHQSCAHPNPQHLWICYLNGKRDFECMIDLRILWWEIILNYPDGLNVT